MKYLILFFVLMTCQLHGQAMLSFDEINVYFGTISQDELVFHTFRLKNMGPGSIKIDTVIAACDCTTSRWENKLLAAGDSVFVTAEFNPFNRTGTFNKLITVISSDGRSIHLKINGNVRPRNQMVKNGLPISLGNLYMAHRKLNMGQLVSNQEETRMFPIYNTADTAITFLLDESTIPECIRLTVEPTTLPAKTEGVMFVVYNAKKRNDLGFLQDGIVLITTDENMPIKNISVIATIQEYFDPIMPQASDQFPKLVFELPKVDFGKMLSSGKVKSSAVTLYNEGNEVLNIRTIKSDCGCVQWHLAETNINPKGSVTLLIAFNPYNRKGRQLKNLTIFSNDPIHPTQVLPVVADIP